MCCTSRLGIPSSWSDYGRYGRYGSYGSYAQNPEQMQEMQEMQRRRELNEPFFNGSTWVERPAVCAVTNSYEAEFGGANDGKIGWTSAVKNLGWGSTVGFLKGLWENKEIVLAAAVGFKALTVAGGLIFGAAAAPWILGAAAVVGLGFAGLGMVTSINNYMNARDDESAKKSLQNIGANSTGALLAFWGAKSAAKSVCKTATAEEAGMLGKGVKIGGNDATLMKSTDLGGVNNAVGSAYKGYKLQLGERFFNVEGKGTYVVKNGKVTHSLEAETFTPISGDAPTFTGASSLQPGLFGGNVRNLAKLRSEVRASEYGTGPEGFWGQCTHFKEGLGLRSKLSDASKASKELSLAQKSENPKWVLTKSSRTGVQKWVAETEALVKKMPESPKKIEILSQLRKINESISKPSNAKTTPLKTLQTEIEAISKSIDTEIISMQGTDAVIPTSLWTSARASFSVSLPCATINSPTYMQNAAYATQYTAEYEARQRQKLERRKQNPFGGPGYGGSYYGASLALS